MDVPGCAKPQNTIPAWARHPSLSFFNRETFIRKGECNIDEISPCGGRNYFKCEVEKKQQKILYVIKEIKI